MVVPVAWAELSPAVLEAQPARSEAAITAESAADSSFFINGFLLLMLIFVAADGIILKKVC